MANRGASVTLQSAMRHSHSLARGDGIGNYSGFTVYPERFKLLRKLGSMEKALRLKGKQPNKQVFTKTLCQLRFIAGMDGLLENEAEKLRKLEHSMKQLLDPELSVGLF